MDILYRLNEATAAEVQNEIDDPLNYSTVRALLQVLERKDIRHREREVRYVYAPVVSRQIAAESALNRFVRTFYDDSPEFISALLRHLNEEQLDAFCKKSG